MDPWEEDVFVYQIYPIKIKPFMWVNIYIYYIYIYIIYILHIYIYFFFIYIYTVPVPWIDSSHMCYYLGKVGPT